MERLFKEGDWCIKNAQSKTSSCIQWCHTADLIHHIHALEFKLSISSGSVDIVLSKECSNSVVQAMTSKISYTLFHPKEVMSKGCLLVLKFCFTEFYPGKVLTTIHCEISGFCHSVVTSLLFWYVTGHILVAFKESFFLDWSTSEDRADSLPQTYVNYQHTLRNIPEEWRHHIQHYLEINSHWMSLNYGWLILVNIYAILPSYNFNNQPWHHCH
jgi:hypothetical protein